MTLNKIKPVIEELDGERCVIVETGINQERATFLRKLLEHNGFTVKEKLAEDNTTSLGVTDLMFNPVLDVYKRRLKSFSGKRVTPAYWLQLSDAETEEEVNYWNFKK
ncbi:MAG: BRCT domain-containing protein [Bacteroidales bacterium]